MELQEYSTEELIEELKERENVEVTELPPYVEHDFGVIGGPATVITVME